MGRLFLFISLYFTITVPSITVLNAQYVAIPDSNFASWLNDANHNLCIMGSNVNGWQLDTTCSAILKDSIAKFVSLGIRDLTGIQYFKNIKKLYCEDNHLTWLPQLPESLQILYCAENHLTKLNALPKNLIVLECSDNKLDSIPNLPVSLRSLRCSNNQLIALPILPDSLTGVSCSNNHLKHLPELPITLKYLWCGRNNLESLPQLPVSLESLTCDSNFALSDLPVLHSKLFILNLCETNIHCLHQPVQAFYSDCQIEKMPICKIK